MIYFHATVFAELSKNRHIKEPWALTNFDKTGIFYISIQRRVEQLAARRAHNPEVAGSSPVPAKA